MNKKATTPHQTYGPGTAFIRQVAVVPSLIPKVHKHGQQIAKAFAGLYEQLLTPAATSRGVNFEPYTNSKDPRFRTARLTDDMRALIWFFEEDGTALIWDFGNHDLAERAATSARCSIDPVSGGLRIFAAVEMMHDSAAPEPVLNESLLNRGDVHHLLRNLEAPADLADLVCLARSVDDLDLIRRLLPHHERPIMAAWMLAEGRTPDEAYRDALQLPADRKPVTVQSALLTSIELGQLRVIRGHDDLAAALASPWEHWLTYLDPAQREIAYKPKYNGPAKVTGGPGTGKTVVAVHRVKHLVDSAPADLFETPRPVLLTTFVKSTVRQLEQMVDRLVTSPARDRVQVRGIDALVVELLKARSSPARGFKPLDDAALRKRFTPLLQEHGLSVSAQRALALWEDVFLALDDPTLEAARSLRPRGGLARMSTDGWQRFREACAALISSLHQNGETTFLLRIAELLLQLEGAEPLYDHVIVDEAQDLHPLHWRLIRRLVPQGPNDIFLVGDADQRLYRAPYPLSKAGILTSGRSRRLDVAYRSSQEILNFASKLIEQIPHGDLESSDARRVPLQSLFESGHPPTTRQFGSAEEEIRGICSIVREWSRDGIAADEMLICAPTNALCERYAQALAAVGHPAHIAASDDDGAGTPIITFHRAKGREARAVIVGGVSRDYWPGASAGGGEDARIARLLPLYVACTRPRERLVVTWAGAPSVLLETVLGS